MNSHCDLPRFLLPLSPFRNDAATRSADPDARRMQYRQVPRRGIGQRRLPPESVRLRSPRRPLPPDTRDRRTADQPGRSRREPARYQGWWAGFRTREVKGLEVDRERYQRTLLSWLAAGAEPDPRDTPQPVRIEVFPRRAVFLEPRDLNSQKIVVLAHYSDGSDRDVTDLAVFLGNNDAAATVSEQGLVTGTGPGSAFILARFDQFTEGASIIVRPGDDLLLPGDSRHGTTSTKSFYARWPRHAPYAGQIAARTARLILRACYHRPHRPFADTRRAAAAVSGRLPVRKARQAGRRAPGTRRFPRHLGHEMGGNPADPHE